MRENSLDDSEPVLVLIKYSVRFFVIDEHSEGDCENGGNDDASDNQYAQVEHVFLLFGFLAPALLNLGHLVWTAFIHELAEVSFSGILF